MILIEFRKNTFTIGFLIPKSTIKREKVILTFFRPFDHCGVVDPGNRESRNLGIYFFSTRNANRFPPQSSLWDPKGPIQIDGRNIWKRSAANSKCKSAVQNPMWYLDVWWWKLLYQTLCSKSDGISRNKKHLKGKSSWTTIEYFFLCTETQETSEFVNFNWFLNHFLIVFIIVSYRAEINKTYFCLESIEGA